MQLHQCFRERGQGCLDAPMHATHFCHTLVPTASCQDLKLQAPTALLFYYLLSHVRYNWFLLLSLALCCLPALAARISGLGRVGRFWALLRFSLGLGPFPGLRHLELGRRRSAGHSIKAVASLHIGYIRVSGYTQDM